jgi:hypothetical protein
VKVSPIEFQQHLFSSIWDIYKCAFMVLCKPGFIMDQYGWKLEYPNNIQLKFSISYFMKICPAV